MWNGDVINLTPLESERVKLITKNAVEHSTTVCRGTNCFQRIQYAFKNIVSVGTVVHRSPLHDRQHCGRQHGTIRALQGRSLQVCARSFWSSAGSTSTISEHRIGREGTFHRVLSYYSIVRVMARRSIQTSAAQYFYEYIICII